MKIRVNGEERSVAPESTVAALVAELDFRPEQVAVELNRKLVPRRDREQTPLTDGDEVELVTLVGGG